MFSIGEFSKMAKISVKTVRYYDEVGLLKPARVDNWTNYRYYDTDQLVKLQKILVMKRAGLTIKNIQAILSGGDTLAMLQKTRTELTKRKRLLTEDIARLDLLIKNKGEIDMKYQATIKEVPEYTVYYKQGVIKDMNGLTEFVLGAGEEASAANPDLQCEKTGYNYVSYLDEEFANKDIKLEFAEAVEKAGRETGTIKFKTVEPTKVVSVYHQGSYDGLRDAYTLALKWAKESKLEISGLAREVYIDGCWNKDNEADYLTEIQIPVK
jgi:DNA-binding transcriptional MerR regulator